MAEQEQDRTEPATPFKLEEARKRGQVAKSLEVNSFAMIAMGLLVAWAWGDALVRGQLGIHRALFSNVGQIELTLASSPAIFEALVRELTSVFWLFVAALVVVAILGNLVQTGPIFSGHPLKPDFTRLNPAQNLKRLFSTKLLFETTKTLVKLGLFSGVVYLSVESMLPELMSAADRDPRSLAPLLLETSRTLGFQLLMVFLFVVLLDALYTRWDFARRMRMSRREVKEEVRRREGDPLVRARIRELQKEAAARTGSLAAVPDADVIVTNPTRLAIALRYDRETMVAPTVLSKGAGDLAAKIREVGARHGVPIVEDKPLARALFRESAIDQPIPEMHYAAAATVFAEVLRLDARRRRGGHA